VRVAILVPWRTDDGPRAAAWAVCRRRLEAQLPDWPIYEGVSPDGPFQRAAAINDAAAQAGSWDVAVIMDADVLLPSANIREAVRRAAETGKVTWAHRRWRELSEWATKRLTGDRSALYAPGILGPGGVEEADLQADDGHGKPLLDLAVASTTPLSFSCCMAVRRDTWEAIGGFDERFVGWGHEDTAFAAAAAWYAGWDRIEGDVLNLWHPRLPGAGRADKVGHERYTTQAIMNERLGIRYSFARLRDLGWADQPRKAPQEAIDRDIRNLRAMDEARMREYKDDQRWADWWPTIPELVEGARQHRTGTVTLVLHTGGDSANWPTRRGYLERSLASLVERVTGPIVQRVVYDCWGDPDIRADLERLVTPHGFYVVGPEHPTDFTAGMQAMWGYLRKRAKGDYIFAVEDDFTYERDVDLVPMIAALKRNPHLVQMALLRDPCYPDERETAAIGNILGWPRPAFTFRDGWFEHRQFFTLNPSLFRKSLTDRPWPAGKHSETLFGKAVLNDARARSAFWGDGSEYIRHIGEVRAGVGY
jgi:hypothetical protein